MSKFKTICIMCGSEDVNLKPMIFESGATRVQARCGDCDSFDNLSLGSKHFTMPFGKHAGKTIEEIYLSDPNYFSWALDNFTNNKIKDKINSCLNKRR